VKKNVERFARSDLDLSDCEKNSLYTIKTTLYLIKLILTLLGHYFLMVYTNIHSMSFVTSHYLPNVIHQTHTISVCNHSAFHPSAVGKPSSSSL